MRPRPQAPRRWRRCSTHLANHIHLHRLYDRGCSAVVLEQATAAASSGAAGRCGSRARNSTAQKHHQQAEGGLPTALMKTAGLQLASPVCLPRAKAHRGLGAGPATPASTRCLLSLL